MTTCNILKAILLSFSVALSQNEVVITTDPAVPASLGYPLTLTCTVSVAGLTTIEWTESRVNSANNELNVNLSAGISTLRIPFVLSADLGDYTCTAVAGSRYSDTITVTASGK